MQRQWDEGCRRHAHRRTVGVTCRCCCCSCVASFPNPPALRPGTSSSAGPVTPEQLFILHTWQTYFSTVFKTELTVAAQVGKATSLLLPGAQFSVQPFSKPCKGWAAGIQAQVPAELGLWGQMWRWRCYRRWDRVLQGAGQPGRGNGGCVTL